MNSTVEHRRGPEERDVDVSMLHRNGQVPAGRRGPTSKHLAGLDCILSQTRGDQNTGTPEHQHAVPFSLLIANSLLCFACLCFTKQNKVTTRFITGWLATKSIMVQHPSTNASVLPS